MRILALDTATESCSAALLISGETLVRELELDRGHAERILFMIDELMSEAGLDLGSLDAIAFGRGPGGFTGVRLAASVTQGLAFGAGLPVIPISDLQAVAQRAFGIDSAAERMLVCNDARMHEVYWGCFEQAKGLARPICEERVSKPDAVASLVDWPTHIHGAGRGFSAYPELSAGLGDRLVVTHPLLLPRAREIALLAAPVLASGGAVPAEEAIPIYIRDEVARPASP